MLVCRRCEKREGEEIEHVKMAEMHLRFKHSEDKLIHRLTTTMAKREGAMVNRKEVVVCNSIH